MKEFLTIGELAKIFNMDSQLLRHYDAIGLLKPTIRNPQNNRRFYKFDSIYPLATIRYLRKLDFSLQNIDSFIRSENIHDNVAALSTHAQQLQKRCDELTEAIATLQKRLDLADQEKELCQENYFFKATFPQRHYLFIGEELALFSNDSFYFYPTLGFYSKTDSAYASFFGAFLPDPEDIHRAEKNGLTVRTIPAGDYYCGFHHGDYKTIPQSLEKLYAAGKDHCLDTQVVTFNIVDQFMEGDPNNYITRIEVLVRD